jgi:hypothetical protein
MIAVARKHPGVYIDTPPAPPNGNQPNWSLREDSERTPKVLFGTNCPMIAHHHALAGIEDLGLDEDAPAATCTATPTPRAPVGPHRFAPPSPTFSEFMHNGMVLGSATKMRNTRPPFR